MAAERELFKGVRAHIKSFFTVKWFCGRGGEGGGFTNSHYTLDPEMHYSTLD